MERPLYIFGTGGFSRETYWLVHDINARAPAYKVMGFIDVQRHKEFIEVAGRKLPVLMEQEVMSALGGNALLTIGIGTPKVISNVVERYAGRFEFPNLIHPTVSGYFETITWGQGNIVTAGCIFTLDISVGSHNIFNLHTTVGHDAVIGSCNVINPGVNISGGVRIGDRNLLGTNSTILQDVPIGNDNVIGASAMVNRPIGDGSVSVGIPARPMKER
jgi:sugar O-acyltransferase (sialic acid O-acetyltransferase NeuD family)